MALSASLALTAAAAFGGAALAQSGDVDLTYGASLDTLNGSGATGEVMLSLDGNDLTVTVEAQGLSPNLPHAQHLHGALDGTANTCPPPEADTDGDGFVSVAEGVPFYGGINVSLTESGDTSPSSALALDRFPVADGDGNLSYERTMTVSSDVAAAINNLHLVQHGIDLDDSGAYDGDKQSSIADVPFEATVPAACGDVEIASVDGFDVDRLAGPTRIETAVEISQEQFPDGADTVYLARFDLFADAVAGGSLTGGPILLVPTDGDLPGAVADELARLDPDSVKALGGNAAVSDTMVIQAARAAQN
jgi:hypothetical protein